MLARFTLASNFAFAQKARKVKPAHQRIKYYSQFPNKFKLKTRIRAPDLTDPALTFPIRVPIRYRHEFHLRKELFVDNSAKIHWNRLQPNQILLAFENPQYLSFEELVEGLKCLSEVEGQKEHDWNEHEWVSKALQRVRDDFNRIQKPSVMSFYFLMKKLGYSDSAFWKKMYAKIEEHIYDLHGQHFEYIFITYYDRFEELFTAEARAKFNKLMEGRIRKFSPSSIITTFERYMKEERLDTYWMESVFVSLFTCTEVRNQACQMQIREDIYPPYLALMVIEWIRLGLQEKANVARPTNLT